MSVKLGNQNAVIAIRLGRNGDARRKINAQMINFYFLHEVDEQEAEHALSLNKSTSTTRKSRGMLRISIWFYEVKG